MAQFPSQFRQIIDDQVELYEEKRIVVKRNYIPDTTEIPIKDQKRWLRIPDVISVFVDMKGSTQLSATEHENGTAGAYQLFTGTAVRLFAEFDAPYIDVRGDGVFALFDSDQVYTALAAAVSFKTFAETVFVPKFKESTDITLGAHIGIDQKTVLVRKVGLMRNDDRSDRQNEVWAGKPVNMSSKLASRSQPGELWVSDRYFANIKDAHALESCGCVGGTFTGEHSNLWAEEDVTDADLFDFDTAYKLSSRWCENHGEEYCNALLALDASADSRAG